MKYLILKEIGVIKIIIRARWTIRIRGCSSISTIRYATSCAIFASLVLMLTSNTIDITSYIPKSAVAISQINSQDYKVDSLFIALLTNGDASVDYNLIIDSNRSSTNVTLFGETIQNLTLTNYNETEIDYATTGIPNKITVFSKSSPDIHVTYSTSDLVDKQNRNWTFSFAFPDRFLLKIPSRAHIIHMEPPPYMTPAGEQNLWGFGPGNVKVSYVIGPLGTREEAQASIRSLEELIEKTRENHDGIVLKNISFVLDRTKLLFKEEKYLPVISLSTDASALLQNISQYYKLGQTTIAQAQSELQKYKDKGHDISEAEKDLVISRNLFLKGEYQQAVNVAKDTIINISQKSNNFVSFDNSNFILTLALLTIIPSIAIILRNRKSIVKKFMKTELMNYKPTGNYTDSVIQPSGPDSYNKGLASSANSETQTNKGSPLNLNFPSEAPSDGKEIKEHLDKVVREVGNVRKNYAPLKDAKLCSSSLESNPSSNNELLRNVISQMKSDRPYLRKEDKDMLDFMCEKQGSAFESEIRNKFILPRTSLWRLVKRLEREGLVEVTKIGGQNLIKLKFDEKLT